MQVIRILLAVTGVTLLFLSVGQANNQASQKSEWLTILSKLNQNIDKSLASRLEANLLTTYKDELHLISEEWAKQNADKASKSYNEKKNIFYMNAVEQKNKNDFVSLQTAAERASSEVDEALMQEVLNDASAYTFLKTPSSVATVAEIAIGFCFYKALMVHYFLLQRGVAQKHIKKIFAVGPLFYQPLVWKFHVAVAVQAKGKTWVIDPLVKKISTVEEWQKELQTYSAEKPYPRLRFYIAEPQKFLPNSKEYTWELINHTKTKKYNPEFLSYLKKKGQPRN
jgi:hypothetical protein